MIEKHESEKDIFDDLDFIQKKDRVSWSTCDSGAARLRINVRPHFVEVTLQEWSKKHSKYASIVLTPEQAEELRDCLNSIEFTTGEPT